ncbi:MAG: hypothetical protein ABIW36_11895 [Terrimesophilobacter sp.]
MNLELPFVLARVLAGLLMLGGAVWIGGFIALIIFSRSTKKALTTSQRVAVFRELGRRYLKVAGVAFVLVVIPGGVLLASRRADGYTLAVLLIAMLLIVGTAVAVKQARHMSRMRRAAVAEPDAVDPTALHRGTRVASALRASLGVCSLALFVLAVAMV